MIDGSIRLAAVAASESYHLVTRRSVTSTMDEARTLRVAGQATPFWIVAGEQTGGRGRQGRGWSSPPGNLYTTLLLTEPCPQRHAPKLGFVAGLALHDAVMDLVPDLAVRLRLKWPNDLLVGTAKCAGLLLEGQVTGGQFEVAIGMGVNLASAPADTPYPAAALGAELQPATLFAALSARWVERLAGFAGGEGFAATRAAWLERAAFLGQDVTLRLPEGPISGRFMALDPDGRLILQQPQGTRIIDAGDLFFGAAGSQPQ